MIKWCSRANSHFVVIQFDWRDEYEKWYRSLWEVAWSTELSAHLLLPSGSQNYEVIRFGMRCLSLSFSVIYALDSSLSKKVRNVKPSLFDQ